jgi:putative hydrolase of the HAD superfamily
VSGAIHTVTFDCWSTLIYELPGQDGRAVLAQSVARATGVEPAVAAQALAAAWRVHQETWHRREVFGAPEQLQHALQLLGVSLVPELHARLLRELEDAILGREIRAIEGARELLATLRRAGVRTALICDTGFTPGRVVRGLLDRVGLLDHLEVAIFSDEIGVAKPHARAFTSALSALGTVAAGAAHVGDLRRSDVAGAQAAGMTAVRFRGHNDDGDETPSARAGVISCDAAGCNPPCARPEADVVVDTYAQLNDWLAPRLRR